MPAANITILAHVMLIIYALIKKNICQKYNTGKSLWGNIWTFQPSTAEERMSFVDWNRTFLWSLILFSQSQWKWLAPKSFWREALKIQKEIQKSRWLWATWKVLKRNLLRIADFPTFLSPITTSRSRSPSWGKGQLVKNTKEKNGNNFF